MVKHIILHDEGTRRIDPGHIGIQRGIEHPIPPTRAPGVSQRQAKARLLPAHGGATVALTHMRGKLSRKITGHHAALGHFVAPITTQLLSHGGGIIQPCIKPPFGHSGGQQRKKDAQTLLHVQDFSQRKKRFQVFLGTNIINILCHCKALHLFHSAAFFRLLTRYASSCNPHVPLPWHSQMPGFARPFHRNTPRATLVEKCSERHHGHPEARAGELQHRR